MLILSSALALVMIIEGGLLLKSNSDISQQSQQVSKVYVPILDI